MKKVVLMAFAAVVGLCSYGQSTGNLQTVKKERVTPGVNEGKATSWATTPSNANYAPKNVNQTKHMKSGPAVHADSTGRCGNAFGLAFGVYQGCWADPRIHTVTMVHRSDPATNTTDNSTGFLRYDFSTDEGATWPSAQLNVGPIFTPNGDPQGTPFSVARYPEGAIYNPPANTVATNAYVTYFAPLRDNTNGNAAASIDWGGVGYGVSKIGSTTSTAHKDSSVIGDRYYVIPDGFTETENGVTYSVAPSIDETSGTAAYQNKIIINKGVWNAGNNDFDYTRIYLDCPVDLNNNGGGMISTCNIAFAPNGQIGYVTVLGHTGGFGGSGTDSVYFPIVYKTYNGGNTWVGPCLVNVDSVNQLLGEISPDATYNSYGVVDMVVDNNGNLHMIAPCLSNLVPGGVITPGWWGEFDIYTMDGGTTWNAKLLSTPQTYDATFGAGTTADPTVTQATRGQATSTWDGTKLFFTWYDTDTIVYGAAGGNVQPDMHCMGYNVATQMWTVDTNFTAGSNAGGICTFGEVAQYAFTPTGYYNIPSVFNTLASVSNTGEATQLYYITNANFEDANFNVPTVMNTNVVPLTSSGSLNGINEVAPNEFSLSVYPNPATTAFQISYVLSKTSTVNVEVFNILGEKVVTLGAQTIGAGVHATNVNVSSLSNGVYMVKTTIGDKVVTSKLTKI